MHLFSNFYLFIYFSYLCILTSYGDINRGNRLMKRKKKENTKINISRYIFKLPQVSRMERDKKKSSDNIRVEFSEAFPRFIGSFNYFSFFFPLLLLYSLFLSSIFSLFFPTFILPHIILHQH